MNIEITFEHRVNETVAAFEHGGLLYWVLFTRAGDDDSWAVTFSRRHMSPIRHFFRAKRWRYAPSGDRQPFAALGGVTQAIMRFIAEKRPIMIGFKSGNPKLVYAYNRWVQRPATRRAMRHNGYFLDVSDKQFDDLLFRQFLFTSERYVSDLVRLKAFENANCLSDNEVLERTRIIIAEKFNTVPDYTPPTPARPETVYTRVDRVIKLKKEARFGRIPTV